MRLFKSIYSPLSLGEGSGVRLLFACLLFASCSQESIIPSTDAEEIRLSGGINGLSASAVTRGAIDKDYSQNLSIRFARVDQGEDGSWPAYTTVATPLEATRAGGAGQTNIGFTKPQYYLTRQDNNNTKLLGWYPASTYKQSDATVTFDISGGTTDVMVTGEVIGNKVDKFGDSERTFTFSHLLTRVSVRAFGDASAKDNWGVIKSVKVKAQPTSCILKLADLTATWSGSSDLALKNSTNDAAMGDVSLDGKTTTANTASCGYALFKPTATASLTLVVETSQGGSRDVTVTLPAGATPQYFAAGTGYTVTLEFKSITIVPTAAITAWKTDSSTIGGVFPYN